MRADVEAVPTLKKSSRKMFPAEIVEEILSRVDDLADLSSCRLACSLWRDVVDSEGHWARRRGRGSGRPGEMSLGGFCELSHGARVALTTGAGTGKNLVENGCGSQWEGGRGFAGWEHLGRFGQAGQWRREPVRRGAGGGEGEERLPGEMLRDLEGADACMRVPSTLGPNEIHQKFR